MTGVVNCWIGAAVDFRDTLHGFRAGRDMGNTYLEANILQKITATREEVLYEFLMDLIKSYNALYI